MNKKALKKTSSRKTPGKVTILMACRDQKAEFLKAAVDSVLKQTFPGWQLRIIVGAGSPLSVVESAQKFSRDPRIRTLVSKTSTLAGALNTGMEDSTTGFVCVLHSDDLLDSKAVETLSDYIQRYPAVDFFHSARKYIDAEGKIRTGLMPSRETFTLDFFKKHGSPVKHLLCWRREKALEIGGMDEDLTLHGCDDYDFPWSMAEAGCAFKAVKECLYYYRIHHDFFRLTTEVPLERQIEVIRKIFKKHGVSRRETEDYIRKARKKYLIKDKTIDYGTEKIEMLATSRFREFSGKRSGDFYKKGYKIRYFFPHRIHFLQKGGPDGLKMALRMCGISDPGKLWELVLYAAEPCLEEFPEELFFDDEIVWHQQHFGRPGQIATANLVIKGNEAFGMNYLSDLVQRISRRRAFKTRIENRFKGWHRLLLNGIMNFALEKKLKTVNSPSADLVMAFTDPGRKVKRELFERVYDRALLEHYQVKKNGGWWSIDVEKNREKVTAGEKKEEVIEFGKTICLCHDIERGWGHRDIDPDFADSANSASPGSLDEMMAIEKEMDIKTTCFVLGSLLNETREKIEKNGHCLAFHSYDHQHEDQLIRCRRVDYRIKGYRPPRSILSSELSDEHLSYHNFEWLASSSGSLGLRSPKMRNGIVKIPILFDDFGLHERRVGYEEWEKNALEKIKQNYFVAFSLHDCYAGHWLPHYREFLEKIRGTGRFKTLDAVAGEVILGSSK